MNKVREFIYGLRLDKAIQKANEQLVKTNARQYVMPLVGTVGKLWIVDRKAFRTMKKEGRIGKSVNLHDVARECFYHTPHGNGSGEICDTVAKLKKEQYLAWIDQERSIHRLRWWQLW